MHAGHIANMGKEKQFGIIIMNHVLEHTNDPLKFLFDVKDHLLPNGVLYIAVPNVDCWEAIFSGWTSYEPYHLLYFNLKTLRTCVERQGLYVESIKTNESFSGWFLMILRTLMKINQSNSQKRHATKVKHTNKLIEHIY